MPDYKDNLNYKIVCNDTDIKDEYFGSTVNLRARRNKHKSTSNDLTSHKQKYKLYDFINKNGGWDNFKIVLVEYYPCNTKLECLKRERELIELYKPSLNTILKTYRTKEDIALHKLEYQREYRKGVLRRDKNI